VASAQELPRMLRVVAAGQQYATPLHEVQEVVSLARLTRIPGSPAYVLGLMNLRGVLVTVLDLAIRLGHREAAAESGVVLLVPRAGGGMAGCMVDSVRDVIPAPEAVTPHPGNAEGPRIVLGVADHAGDPVVVVDLRAFIRDALR
jgi:purine-binding chemotaxis protein CheW